CAAHLVLARIVKEARLGADFTYGKRLVLEYTDGEFAPGDVALEHDLIVVAMGLVDRRRQFSWRGDDADADRGTLLVRLHHQRIAQHARHIGIRRGHTP